MKLLILHNDGVFIIYELAEMTKSKRVPANAVERRSYKFIGGVEPFLTNGDFRSLELYAKNCMYHILNYDLIFSHLVTTFGISH